ncbi:helix-turn-helix transcriptional regulator [Natrialbaceae archaeon A-CW3]
MGKAVAFGMNDLVGQVETGHKLRDVWQQLPEVVIEFSLGTGSTVARSEHDAPYRPLNRYRALFRESNRYRFVGFDVGLYEACKDEFEQRVLDGLETEIIDPPSVARYMITTYPERCADLLECDNMTVLLHDDVPSYGLCLFDDQIAVCVYNLDGGGMKALIDTDTPEAREWAESVYATYKVEAQPLEVQQIID